MRWMGFCQGMPHPMPIAHVVQAPNPHPAACAMSKVQENRTCIWGVRCSIKPKNLCFIGSLLRQLPNHLPSQYHVPTHSNVRVLTAKPTLNQRFSMNAWRCPRPQWLQRRPSLSFLQAGHIIELPVRVALEGKLELRTQANWNSVRFHQSQDTLRNGPLLTRKCFVLFGRNHYTVGN
jgi:hypothetical protein